MPEFKRITKANSAFEIAPTTDDADTLLFKATDKNGAVLFQIDTAKGASSTGTTYDLALTGAKGDGIQDDTSYIVAALVKAGSTGTVISPPGKTYLITSTITMATNGARMDLAGSTIKKKSTMTTEAFNVSGTGVVIRNLTVDGSKAAGATASCVKWSGTSGVLENATVIDSPLFGVWLNGGSLDCRNVASSGHTFDGFFVDSAGVISTDHLCRGFNNGRTGLNLNNGGLGCHIDGTFYLNGIVGVWIFAGNKGTSDLIRAYDNGYQNVGIGKGDNSHGLSLLDWKFGTIISYDQGLTINNLNGANVELWGCSRCQFGTIITRGGGGWGLVLAANDGGNVGATGFGTSDCSFGTVICDNNGGNDTDPGLSWQFGCKRNHFGFVSIRGHSWALSVSEELEPLGNDYNSIGVLEAQDCPWGIVFGRGGSYNHIGRIVARDCGTADPTLARGLIEWKRHDTAGGGNCRGNTIGFLDYRDSRTTSTRPMALVHFDSTESGNLVLDGIARGTDADVNDENGGNSVTLRPMLRQTSLETFEAGWTNGADNLTAGQFVEGTKGRRLVSNTSATALIFKTGLALNLSGMGDDEWFRWFVYLENVSDKNASNPILLRMGTDASNYFQWAVAPEALRVNGPQYLRARKGGFTTVGSPSWASIARIDFFAVSAAANTFAVTFDNLERIYPDRYSAHIGGVLPHGMPVASGGVLISTGKINVNDAGTWKSATAS
jgi:hypothetical protein